MPNTFVTDAKPLSYEVWNMAQDPSHPTHLAVGYSDGSAQTTCYAGMSDDGGRTWHDEALAGEGTPFPVPPGSDWCYSSDLAYGSNGTLFALITWSQRHYHYGRMALMSSADGGAHFSAPPLHPA